MAIDAGTIISSLELDTGSFTSSMDEAIDELYERISDETRRR